MIFQIRYYMRIHYNMRKFLKINDIHSLRKFVLHQVRRLYPFFRPSHTTMIFTAIHMYQINCCENQYPYYNTVEKIVAVVKKVLDCMNDTCIFAVFLVVCEGLYTQNTYVCVLFCNCCKSTWRYIYDYLCDFCHKATPPYTLDVSPNCVTSICRAMKLKCLDPWS